MNPKAITDTLRAVCTDLTGVDCDTGNEAGSYAADGDQTSIDIRLRGVEAIGRDETRTVYDPSAVIPGDVYQPDPLNPSARLGGVVSTVSGNRKLAVQVLVDCADQTVTAFYFTELIRVGLKLPRSRTTLKAAGLAIHSIGKSTPLPAEYHANRELSRAVLEFWLNSSDALSDRPITTIEDVDVHVTPTPG